MNDWLTYFIGYLVTGPVLLAIAYLSVRLREKQPLWQWSASSRTPLTLKRMQIILLETFTYALVLIIWPVVPMIVIWDLISDHFRKDTPWEPTKVEPFIVQIEEASEKLKIEEIEQRELISDPLGAVPDVPFGHLNTAWEKFKATIQEGDEIWSFESRRTERRHLCELCRGYTLSRRGIFGEHHFICEYVDDQGIGDAKPSNEGSTKRQGRKKNCYFRLNLTAITSAYNLKLSRARARHLPAKRNGRKTRA